MEGGAWQAGVVRGERGIEEGLEGAVKGEGQDLARRGKTKKKGRGGGGGGEGQEDGKGAGAGRAGVGRGMLGCGVLMNTEDFTNARNVNFTTCTLAAA